MKGRAQGRRGLATGATQLRGTAAVGGGWGRPLPHSRRHQARFVTALRRGGPRGPKDVGLKALRASAKAARASTRVSRRSTAKATAARLEPRRFICVDKLGGGRGPVRPFGPRPLRAPPHRRGEAHQVSRTRPKTAAQPPPPAGGAGRHVRQGLRRSPKTAAGEGEWRTVRRERHSGATGRLSSVLGDGSSSPLPPSGTPGPAPPRGDPRRSRRTERPSTHSRKDRPLPRASTRHARARVGPRRRVGFGRGPRARPTTCPSQAPRKTPYVEGG